MVPRGRVRLGQQTFVMSLCNSAVGPLGSLDMGLLLCVNVTQLLLTRASQTLRYKLGSSHRVARCPVGETRWDKARLRMLFRQIQLYRGGLSYRHRTVNENGD